MKLLLLVLVSCSTAEEATAKRLGLAAAAAQWSLFRSSLDC
jgi:hypothetical protein